MSGNVTLYADDKCLFCFLHSIHDIIQQAQGDLNMLQRWFHRNFLTKYLYDLLYDIFRNKQKHT